MANDVIEPEPGTPRRQLAAALSEPLIGAYHAGGFGLAFLVLGAIFLSSGEFLSSGLPSYLLGTLGALLVLVPCYFFFVKEIRPIRVAQRQVKQNEDLLNGIQDAAETMTRTALELQSLAYKYADQVAQAIAVARPALKRIPLLRAVAEGPQLQTADWLTANVTRVTKSAEDVIREVHEALRQADARALHKYVGELKKVRAEIEGILVAPALVRPEDSR